MRKYFLRIGAMRSVFTLCVALLVAAVFTGCGDDNNGYEPDVPVGGEPPKEHEKAKKGDVFVVGRNDGGSGFWKNGVEQKTYNIHGSIDGYVNFKNVQVSEGGDVYVLGMNDTWIRKNGIILNYGYTTLISFSSLFVSNNDVYLTVQSQWSSHLYKNGVEMPLNDCSWIGPVFVSDGVIYTAGRSSQGPTIWKNQEKEALFVDYHDRHSITPTSVYVSGNDIYGAGNIHSYYGAFYWKNDDLYELSESESEAHSIFVSNGIAYVAGWERNAQGKKVAKLWKDGVGQNITDGTFDAEAFSVYVAGNDVYIAGYENKITLDGWGNPIAGDPQAKLWKNNIAQILSEGAGVAHCVFVVE